MRLWIAALIVTAGLMATGDDRVRAQDYVESYAPSVVYSSAYVPPAAPTSIKPYSYYVLPPSVPSRVYVGPNEFPFYGNPYGHVYDRWTWQYLSQPNGGMNRYYYPPLGY